MCQKTQRCIIVTLKERSLVNNRFPPNLALILTLFLLLTQIERDEGG